MSQPREFRLRLLVALLVVALAPRAARSDDPPADDPVRDAVLKKLRSTCASETETILHGARVEGADVKAGRLELKGTLDRADQAAPLSAAARRIIEGDAPAKAAFPQGAATGGMTVFPVRSDFLPRLRRDFAAQGPGLLARTRLEDVFYDEEGLLHVVALCIDQPAHVVATTGKTPEGAESSKDDLIQKLEGEVRDRLKGYVKAGNLGEPDLKVKVDVPRDFLEGPARYLQGLVNQDARLDAVLLQDAWFDGEGALQLGGLVGVADQLTAVAGFLKSPDFLKKYGPVSLSGSAGPERVLGAMKIAPWNGPLLKDLQGRLAGHETLKYCRLARARFVYPARGDLLLRFEGVGFLRGAEGLQESLTSFLRDESRKALKATGALTYSVEEKLEQFPNPRHDLQVRVAADPALDGARIDDVAFGPYGEVALSGLWTSAAQTVVSTLVPMLRQLVPPLGDGGPPWNVSGMSVLPTDQLLRDLRAWTASKIAGEVCLERAYFPASEPDNAPALLQIQGFAGPEGKKAAEDQIGRWIEGHAVVRRLAELSRAKGPKGPWALALAPSKVSLVAELRKLVPQDPSLDGVRIDGGSYDENEVFVLNGLQDHSGQAEQLIPLLNRAARDGGFANQLPRGARAGNFADFPIRPMLVQLARVLPSNPVFDGVTIDRAFYNEKTALVLAGRALGRDVPPDLSGPLKTVLRAAPQLEVKTALTPQPRNPELSAQAVVTAVAQIDGGNPSAAVDPLDRAVLHNPNETAAWFLRAGCYLNQGDTALAERDMRRLKDLERRSPSLTRTRFQKLERLQGPFRIAANDLEARIGVEAAAP